MGLENSARASESRRWRIQRELELMCGTDCSRIVQGAMRASGMSGIPEGADQLRTFIYFHLYHELLRRYQEEEIAMRLCEVVATAMLSDTGMVRLPEARSEAPRQSAPEIPPPSRTSLSPSRHTDSLAELLRGTGRKRR